MTNGNGSKVEMRLPFGQTVVLGLQHVLAMYAGAVSIPLIIGGALGFNSHQLALLIAADLFTCGIATLLQSFGIGNFVGIKLPVILGCTFTTIGPMIGIAAGANNDITYVYGAIIAGGLFVVLLAQFIGKLLKFFPQVVTGTIVTIIGISLIPVAIANVQGGYGSPTYGSPTNFYLAAFTILVIIVANRYFKGFLQAISVLIGLIVGTIVAAMGGMVSLKAVGDASWLSLVQPFVFGAPKFNISAIITMCITLLVVMAESMGTFLGVGELCDKKITSKDLVRGYRAEGLATILGGIFNSFPYTTFYQNLGLVAITKVTSRFVVVASGVILVILGCIPKFAALVTIIPAPVLGGAMLVMFGMVAVSGLNMLQRVDFAKSTNMLIVAVSLGVGIGISVTPNIFAQFPQFFNTLFGQSGIVPGSIVAVLLNLALNFKETMSQTEEDIAKAAEHHEAGMII